MRRTLVIGATGNVGGKVVEQLVAEGTQVRAMVRNPGSPRLPDCVEVVQGDLTVPESLDRCLDGIKAVFLVWTAPPATAEVAVGRIAKHAERLVYLSAPLKTPHPFFQQPNASRARGERMEQLIEGSGVDWTFLRPHMFAENSIGFWASQIRSGDLVRWPYADVATAPIDEADIARVAVRALTSDGHSKAEYVITGPESLTQAEQISIIGQALGRTLRVENLSPEEAHKELAGVIPPGVLGYLLDAWGAAVGLPAWVTNTVEDVTGAPARTFQEWAAEHRWEFQG